MCFRAPFELRCESHDDIQRQAVVFAGPGCPGDFAAFNHTEHGSRGDAPGGGRVSGAYERLHLYLDAGAVPTPAAFTRRCCGSGREVFEFGFDAIPVGVFPAIHAGDGRGGA